MEPWKLEEYLTEEGRSPFRDWLVGLRDVAGRARIRARLNRVRLGNFGDAKSVGDGVFEFRISFGPGYRVYFAKEASKVVLLLCGGDKGTQRRDIAKAKRFWLDHQRRPQ